MKAMVATPKGPAFLYLRQQAGLTQHGIAATLRDAGLPGTQTLVGGWDKGAYAPSPEAWTFLERTMALGKPKGRERVKWVLAAHLGGGDFRMLYSEGETLGVWLNRGLAHSAADTLRVLGQGYLNEIVAMPCFGDWIADRVMEGGEAWFAADEMSTGAKRVQEWFAERARLLDHLAGVMRHYTAVAAAQGTVKT
jgi:hypothetical protein